MSQWLNWMPLNLTIKEGFLYSFVLLVCYLLLFYFQLFAVKMISVPFAWGYLFLLLRCLDFLIKDLSSFVISLIWFSLIIWFFLFLSHVLIRWRSHVPAELLYGLMRKLTFVECYILWEYLRKNIDIVKEIHINMDPLLLHLLRVTSFPLIEAL